MSDIHLWQVTIVNIVADCAQVKSDDPKKKYTLVSFVLIAEAGWERRAASQIEIFICNFVIRLT